MQGQARKEKLKHSKIDKNLHKSAMQKAFEVFQIKISQSKAAHKEIKGN